MRSLSTVATGCLWSIFALLGMVIGGRGAIAQDKWEPLAAEFPIAGVSALGYQPSGQLFIGFMDGRVARIRNGVLISGDVGGNSGRIVRFQFIGLDTIFAWLEQTRYDLLRSVDGGATWHPVREPGRLFPPLAVAPGGAIVSMLYESGAQVPKIRSSDGGMTWSRIDTTQFDLSAIERCVDMTAGSDGALYAGFQGDSARNLYRSEDGGETWRPLSLGAGSISHIVATESGAILAATMTDLFDPAEARGVYRSDDGGENWTLTLPLGIDGQGGMPSLLSVDMPPAYSPAAGTMMITGGARVNLMRSTDDGRSWRSMTTGGLRDTLIVAVAASDDGTIVCATLENIYRYAGVAGIADNGGMNDMPAPASRVEKGELVVTGAGVRMVELYDMRGRCIRREGDMPGGGGDMVRMTVGDLPSAPYLLLVRGAGDRVHTTPLHLVR